MANTIYVRYQPFGGVATVYFNRNDDGNNSPYRALIGASNLLAPPWAPAERSSPLQPGGFFSFVGVGIRVVTLPILVTGTSLSNLFSNARSLITSLDPTVARGTPFNNKVDGSGYLIVTGPDGNDRWLKGNFVAGLDGDFSSDNFGAGFLMLPAEFHAVNPFWFTNSLSSDTRTNISNNTTDTHTLTVTGDAEAWPVFTITFVVPASTGAQTVNLSLQNTANYTFSMTGIPIPATSGSPVTYTMTLTWNPTGRSYLISPALAGGVTDLTQYIDLTSATFPITPAPSTCQLVYKLTGSVAVNNTISVQVQYNPRWNTA